MSKTEWTNPKTDEKFIHKDLKNGKSQFLYGPKDKKMDKRHGHAEFDASRNITFNRKPKGE